MFVLTTVMGMSLVSFGLENRPPSPGTQPPLAPRKARAAPADEHWTPLFNGRNLDGWYTFLQKHGKNNDPDHVIAIEDGAIHLYKDAAEGSQVVMGYISTDKEYGNYHLRLGYRLGHEDSSRGTSSSATRDCITTSSVQTLYGHDRSSSRLSRPTWAISLPFMA